MFLYQSSSRISRIKCLSIPNLDKTNQISSLIIRSQAFSKSRKTYFRWCTLTKRFGACISHPLPESCSCIPFHMYYTWYVRNSPSTIKKNTYLLTKNRKIFRDIVSLQNTLRVTALSETEIALQTDIRFVHSVTWYHKKR